VYFVEGLLYNVPILECPLSEVLL